MNIPRASRGNNASAASSTRLPCPQALERLSGSGIKLALLTNGSTDKQWGKIRQFGLSGFFDHIQMEGDLGFGKPDARAFRYALAALDVGAEEAWMVGDNLLADIEGAQGTGIFVVWIDAHGSGLDARPGVAPDGVVGSLDDLLETLPSRTVKGERAEKGECAD